MSNKFISVFIIVIVAIVAGVVFLRARPADQNNAQNGGGAISTADWKTYRNETYGFEVKLPSDWAVKIIEPEQFPGIDPSFRPRNPILHFLSSRELDILDNLNYSDRPVGFLINVFQAAGDTSLESWVQQKFGDNSPFVDPQVTPVQYIRETAVGVYRGYAIHQAGLGEGTYSFIVENLVRNERRIFSIDAFSRDYVGDNAFQEILKSFRFIEL